MSRPCILVLLVALAVPASAGESKRHPRLVSVSAARCTDCHADLLKGRGTAHAPAEDDCTTCHEMSVAGGETRVALVDSEPALCLLCHDDLRLAAEADLDTPHAPVTDSCLTCHDPHASGERPLLSASVPELCADCHDLADLDPLHGGQLTAGSDCRRCHQPHGSRNDHMLLGRNQHAPFAEGSCKGCHRAPFGDRVRLARRGENLCFACHGDLLAPEDEAVSAHAALVGERGRAGCLGCHDPHMSDQGKLLSAASPELCRQCHGGVVAAAEAETGHAAAADDCLNCHLPHDAPQADLLSEPPEELCGICHDTGDADLARAHLGADLAALVCTRCHTPHGSGHPKLLAKNLHEPVLDGCDTCHEGGFDELVEGGESALCLLCHDDVGELALQAAVPHGAMEIARCADCHNPHASAQEHLVKLPAGGACTECHDDISPGDGEVAHGVIELVGCRACHEPHGGSREKLLRATDPELCLSCHDVRAVRPEEGAETAKLLDRFEVPADLVRTMATLTLSADGQRNHPVTGHRVLGTPTESELELTETTHEGELTCLTCHDPHKGRSRQILRWGAATAFEACQHCHPK